MTLLYEMPLNIIESIALSLSIKNNISLILTCKLYNKNKDIIISDKYIEIIRYLTNSSIYINKLSKHHKNNFNKDNITDDNKIANTCKTLRIFNNISSKIIKRYFVEVFNKKYNFNIDIKNNNNIHYIFKIFTTFNSWINVNINIYYIFEIIMLILMKQNNLFKENIERYMIIDNNKNYQINTIAFLLEMNKNFDDIKIKAYFTYEVFRYINYIFNDLSNINKNLLYNKSFIEKVLYKNEELYINISIIENYKVPLYFKNIIYKVFEENKIIINDILNHERYVK